MSNPLTATVTLFETNRTEELGYDVWEHFVLPPFFDQLAIDEARKPRIFIAGRGCGKTMLLRYLSHRTQFSVKRPVVPPDTIKHIGLYWRADTQFANAMAKRTVPDETWESAFHHLLALVFGIETLESVMSIATSSLRIIDGATLETLELPGVTALDPSLPTRFPDLLSSLQQRLWALQAWVNNVKKLDEPIFLPGRHFLIALIQIIKGSLPALREAVFFVYLDEYENLRASQKEAVHTCLKHSDYGESLIFNLAVKRHALGVPRTLGPESIAHIHDWRYLDLEEFFLDKDFPLFAAEILLMHLSVSGAIAVPIDVEALRRTESLLHRRTPEYRDKVLAAAHQAFPDVSEDGLAKGVFEDRALSNVLKERILKALRTRKSTIDPAIFARPELPKASIITPALLSRPSLTVAEIEAELDALATGAPNRFTGSADWIHNNFIGCLLQLYEPYARPCPFYAGFSTFCKLAHGNIRHMLELCHRSVKHAARESGNHSFALRPEQEAIAARLASAAFLGEIRSFGPQGNQLHAFVMRLGSLFALSHSRPTQSEPEVSHFAVTKAGQPFKEEDYEFLIEAVKWSVLFEEPGTKDKDEVQLESLEYVLNPIYAPYFNITYRKRRRLELTSDEAVTLMRGSLDDYRALAKRKSKAWMVDADESPSLFSLLDGAEEK